MKQYLELLKRALEHGIEKDDRTGTGTVSVFAHQMRFDLQKGFPLLTTKKLHIRSIVYELLWMLKGDTNIQFLNDNGVSIWDEWANQAGDLGPVYGKQWRSWQCSNGQTVDQIHNLIHGIQNNPNSRRHIVSAWNVGEIEKMALPPCHLLFQFYVANNRLSCQLYQRSADIFLGVPFNIASYALLTHMIAHYCHMDVGEFVWTGGDCHLYTNHLEQAALQLTRAPFALPKLQINRRPEKIDGYQFDDFSVINYQHHPHIKAVVSV